MAVILPRSIFFHVPKTGGMFVRAVIPKAGIAFVRETGAWDKHDYPAQIDTRGRFTFAFVRDPLAWYESFYHYHTFVSANGWEQQYEMHRLCGFSSFDHMVEKMMVYFPGHVSAMYKMYTQVDTPDEIDFIGRQENLRVDLVRALGLAGEEFDETVILSFAKRNATVRKRLVWNPLLREKMVKLERFAIDRFGYRDQV